MFSVQPKLWSRILFVDTIFLNLLTTNIVSSIADWNEPFQVLYFFANLDELVVLYLNINHLSLALSTPILDIIHWCPLQKNLPIVNVIVIANVGIATMTYLSRIKAHKMSMLLLLVNVTLVIFITTSSLLNLTLQIFHTRMCSPHLLLELYLTIIIIMTTIQTQMRNNHWSTCKKTIHECRK